MFQFTIRVALWLMVAVGLAQTNASADIAGPTLATSAISPDGNLIARVVETKNDTYELVYFSYDKAKERYERKSSFALPVQHLSQYLFVSDSGDLILVYLGHEEAIRLYSNDGKTQKVWNLDAFLSDSEIRACAKTGSTLQWFDEGMFVERRFQFEGPSRNIRSLRGSYTIMRPANPRVSFDRSIDAAEGTVTKR